MKPKPSYYFLILLLTCISIGCKQNKTNNKGSVDKSIQNEVIDSIQYYLDEAYNEEHNVEKRKELAWKAYALTSKLHDSLKASHYINIGNRFTKVNDDDNYYYFNQKALKVATEVSDKKALARIFYNLGRYYSDKNYRSDSAYYYYNKAKKLYAELDDTLWIGMALRNISIIQNNENDFLGSEVSIKNAISYFKLTKNDLYLGYAYNSLGNIADELGQYDDAIKYYKESLKYRKKINAKLSEVYPLNNIGEVYQNQGKYKKALSYYQQVLAYDHFFEEIPDFYSEVLGNIAHANFKLGNAENLPQQYFKALKIADSLNDIPRIINRKLNLAEYYQAYDSIDLAKKYAYEAKAHSENSKHKDNLLKSLLMLSKLESGEKAQEFTNLYIKMQDSLKKNEINTAKELLADVNLEVDEITQQKEKVTYKNKILTLSVIFLFVTFTTLYFLRQKKYKKYKKRFEQIINEEKSIPEKSANNILNKKKELDLDEAIVNNILSQLEEFESGTKYLKKGMNLSVLSKKLNTNSSYLSKVINTYKEKNFTNYINDLKINYIVKRLQDDKKIRLYTIQAISEEIGFNNSKTFSSIFYKKTGIYPSYFIAQLEKRESV